MRKVEIEIPDGKMAKWVNGVLTLVDDKKPQNIMERIKTFEDAVVELSNRAMNGDKDAGKLLDEWKVNSQVSSKDLLAYLKLRIITYALNEGWKPQFTNGENRAYNVNASLYSLTSHSSRLVFKSEELAEYAGKQFVKIYVEYCLI